MAKEIVFTFDGNDIQAELGKGFPPGATAEKEAEKYLKGIAVKERLVIVPIDILRKDRSYIQVREL